MGLLVRRQVLSAGVLHVAAVLHHAEGAAGAGTPSRTAAGLAAGAAPAGRGGVRGAAMYSVLQPSTANKLATARLSRSVFRCSDQGNYSISKWICSLGV